LTGIRIFNGAEMQFGVVTLFPEMFSVENLCGVLGRAVKRGLLSVECWNPRNYAQDKHRTVDDRPYGGGPGMLMKVAPLREALRQAKAAIGSEATVIYLSPQGARLDHEKVLELAVKKKLILLAGRYEGVDERVIQAEVDEEISIGDFVLSGGELPALVLIDAVSRQVPGVLGHSDSAGEDSFYKGLLDCPHYTRPELVDGETVPEVLTSGDHEKIRRWRLKQALGRTWQRRPDLLVDRELDVEEKALLEEFISEVK